MAKHPPRHRSICELLETRRLLSVVVIQNGAAIQPKLDAAHSGDIIEIGRGNYAGGLVVETPNLTIEGIPGSPFEPVITAPAGVNNIYFDTPATGGTLKRLDLKGGLYGVKFEQGCTHGTVTQSTIEQTASHGIKVSPDANFTTISYNILQHIGLNGIDWVGGDNGVIAYNTIDTCGQNGLFVKGGSRDCSIIGNLTYEDGYGGILLGQSTSYANFNSDVNPNLYEAIDCVASGNAVYQCQYEGMGLWGAYGCTIKNNTISGNAIKGQASIFMVAAAHPDDPNDPNQVALNTNDIVTGNTIQQSSSRPTIFNTGDGPAVNVKFIANRYKATTFSVEDDYAGTFSNWSQWQKSGQDAGSTMT